MSPTRSRVTLPEQQDLIDGRWVAAGTDRSEWIEHSADGRAEQVQREATPESIERALAAAWRVHESAEWWRLDDAARAAVLDTAADRLAAEVPEIAALESATTGVVNAMTNMLGFIVHGAFRLAADQLRAGVLDARFDGPTGAGVEVRRLPFGPALLLCPWNAPAPMAAHKMASALAAGCPVIVKPPERAPHGTVAMVRAIDGLFPSGTVQLLHGGPATATALMTDRRVRSVSFTGGIVGGRAVAHACAEGLKPAQLELGGHSPLVVLEDAPVAHAVEAVLGLSTTLNGQWCRALGRLLLPASRADEILEATAAALTGVRVGDPMHPDTQMGPMVHSAHRRHLVDRVAALGSAGGRIIATTTLPDGPGNWFAPTLVDGLDPSSTTDEIFGPVAAIHRWRDVDEAVALANGTDYGLEAYVVGGDSDRAMAVARRIRAGGVKVNGVLPMSLDLMAPRPAFGISGLHDEGTVETIHFFGGNRVTGVESSLGQTPPG